MKFSAVINKSAIFYFFIQNLSEWHFSNRKDYNEVWRQEIEPFTTEEENVLKKVREIHLRYPFGESYLGRVFFLEENLWAKLEQRLTREEFTNLEKAFSVFENKFNSFWTKESTLLSGWKTELEKKLNHSLATETVVKQLKMIFNTTSYENEIKIYLLPSTEKHVGGGANIDSKSITLEISRYPLQNINHAIGIVWHETIHLSFQKQYLFPLLLELFHDDKKKIDLINEIAVSSLFPKGIMAVRLFKNRPTKQLGREINLQQTVDILNLTKEYIDRKKYFDKEYILKIVEVLRM